VNYTNKEEPPRNGFVLYDFISSLFMPEQKSPPEKRPAIKKIVGSTVIFSDDTQLSHVDAIIWCWGFKYSFPFLGNLIEILPRPSRVCLFEHVFPLHLPGLAFIGLPTVDNSLHPVAEKQAIWVAKILAGKTKLPDLEDTTQSIERWSRALEDYRVKYRPMQVSVETYIKKVAEYIEKYKIEQ